MTKKQKNTYNVFLSASISKDQDKKFKKFADKFFEGNISRAVRSLIDKI